MEANPSLVTVSLLLVSWKGKHINDITRYLDLQHITREVVGSVSQLHWGLYNSKDMLYSKWIGQHWKKLCTRLWIRPVGRVVDVDCTVLSATSRYLLRLALYNVIEIWNGYFISGCKGLLMERPGLPGASLETLTSTKPRSS